MGANRSWLGRIFGDTHENRALMTLYERFEQIIVVALSLIMALVIAIAFFQLIGRIVQLLLRGALDLLDYKVFQSLFGAIMTLLIAMEFEHSIVRVALRHGRPTDRAACA